MCEHCQASHYKVRIVDKEWMDISVGLIFPYIATKAKQAWL